MSIVLPEPLADYFSGEKNTDTAALERCFTADAKVLDEGRVYEGLAAIKAWKVAAQAKYQYSVEPLNVSQTDDVTRVRARLTGNFPGSPAEVTYRFVLQDRRIASLEIGA
ncbi:nuclear transport factor 2 family protein [Pseudomonas sp. XS1P51]